MVGSRARLWAVLVAAHVVFAVPWGLVADGGWVGALAADTEGSSANLYAVGLWSLVGALAATHLRRAPPGTAAGLWGVGWLSVTALAAAAAVEELLEFKTSAMAYAFYSWMELEPRLGWPVLLAAVTIPLAIPAAWALVTALRRRPPLAALAALAIVFAASGLAHDVFDEFYGALDAYLRNGPRPDPVLTHPLEETSEFMAAALLAVVFFELRRSVEPAASIRLGSRRLAFAAAALVIATAVALLAEYQQPDERWLRGPSQFYAGPVVLVEQSIHVRRDNLTRLEVWAAVDAAAAGPAEIFVRVAPIDGDGRPIREARAAVRNQRYTDNTVDLVFAPIPDSGGRTYRLTFGVLSGPSPHVYLGMTSRAMHPEAAVVINGEPSAYGAGLALRAHWVGRGTHALAAVATTHPQVLAEVALVAGLVMLLLLAVAGVWTVTTHELSWRLLAIGTVRRAGLLAIGIATVTIALLPVLVATPHA